MASELLGRTNRAFPKVWYSLTLPSEGPLDGSAERIVEAALRTGAVIDISSSPALWGGMMRGTKAPIVIRGGTEIGHAPSEKIACDLLQAHLVQTLSALGREWIDVYFLKVRANLADHQIDGALRALENAKQEGHVQHIGIECDGPNSAVLSVWRGRDAFELALIQNEDPELMRFAIERRAGIVTCFDSSYAVLQPFSEAGIIGAKT